MQECVVERLDDDAIDDLAESLLAHRSRLHALLGALVRVGQRLDDAMRTPLRVWHARRSPEPAALLARLFVLHDRVALRDVEAALGEISTALLDAGMLSDASGLVTSRVQLGLFGDSMCFGDWLGPAAVLPIGGATAELLRVACGAPASRALDLGCGAGSVAIAMARVVTKVVATDIDPRAAAFTRFNARLNRAGNVEVRVGDSFEPVRQERFDRIAAQPPFHALRPGGIASMFVHGGPRGDEVATSMLANAPEQLERHGTMLLLADWPLAKGDALATRLHVDAADVLVLRAPNKDLDEYCTLHAAFEHPALGEDFSNAVIAQRDHLEALGIHAIALAWVVLRRATAGGWASEVSVKHPHDAPMTWEHACRIFDAHAAAHATDDALLGTRVVMPTESRWVEQSLAPSEPAVVVVHPPSGRPEWPCVLDASLAALASAIATAGHPTNAAEVAAARRALLLGALDVKPSQDLAK